MRLTGWNLVGSYTVEHLWLLDGVGFDVWRYSTDPVFVRARRGGGPFQQTRISKTTYLSHRD